eukprot:6211440-Pleurochrysis_carterae.AAC.1
MKIRQTELYHLVVAEFQKHLDITLQKPTEKHTKIVNGLYTKLASLENQSDDITVYDMMKYSLFYCEQDVRVLSQGWQKFSDLCFEAFDLYVNDFLTINSLTDAYLEQKGCFDGIYELSGLPQQFVKQATVGGRVMAANNDKIICKRKLDDTDANSLYPSAQIRLGGYLKGKPKVWNPAIDLDTVDGYFIKIRVLSLGRKLRFPICRLLTPEGGCDWTNDLVGKELYVDK